MAWKAFEKAFEVYESIEAVGGVGVAEERRIIMGENTELMTVDNIYNRVYAIRGQQDITFSTKLTEQFEFRSILPSEAEQAVMIEQICFPPHEACSEKHMKERIAKVPELFLVAVDRETGKIAGFLNGIATNEERFRDEFFLDANLYEPEGRNVMLLGLDVLPKYRGRGLAREIVRQYAVKERENNRHKLILTCLDAKVAMYEKMGFVDNGIANSTWGNEEWHEMSFRVGKTDF